MKYLYTTLLLLCAISLSSQNRYWVGGSSGDWSNAANWSATSGGAGGAGVPTATEFAIFNTSSDVTLPTGTIDVNGLHILNSSTVKLIANAAITFRLNSQSANVADIGLYIAANSTLIDTMTVGNASYNFNFLPSVKGIVDGTFIATGIPGDAPLTIGKVGIGFGPGSTLQFRSGSIFRNNTQISTNSFGGFVTFEAGSYHMFGAALGGAVHNSNYDANSTLHIYGSPITAMPTIATTLTNVGNLVIDIEGYGGTVATSNNKGLIINNNMNINGNLTFKNTGGEVILTAPPTTSSAGFKVHKNLIIESAAQVAFGSYNNHSANIEIGGNLVMNGGILYFRKTPAPEDVTTYTKPVTLKVLGNIQQTGGSITTGNVDVSSLTDELFVIEMAGTTPQTINAAGNWDNIHQNIVLRINNANGVSLNSPVSVSKISWNSTNKGNINTSAANPLTILNPSTTDLTVYNGVSNNGYVSGPVRRVTNSASSYIFPVGNNGVYRSVSVLPETNTTSTYEAQYYNGSHPNPTINPLMNGISLVEYWRVARTAGTTAASVQLTLNGAVAGTNTNDGLVVASFNGSQWNSEYTGVVSSMIIPGNSASGTVQTEYINPNRFYTFGFGTATTLPIHLIGFNVKKVGQQQASLTWQVSTESTPQSFIVERSTDGISFKAIGTVNATTATHYQFEDTQLPNGKIYYRLNMKDQDGSSAYSDIQFIQVSNNNHSLQVFPTIAQSQTQLKLELNRSAKVTILVNDNSGRTLQRNAVSLNAGTQYLPIQVAGLANGVYYVVVMYEDGTLSAPQRFIKQ